MIALDYGNAGKLVAWGEDTKITLPRVPKNTCAHSAAKFAWKLAWLLDQDDVVTESATVGSSGAEPEAIRDIVAKSPHTLYVISTRSVKNYLRDIGVRYENGIPDDIAAQSILEIALARSPGTLKLWKYVANDDKLKRVAHTSVRPYDKRDYKDPEVDRLMAYLNLSKLTAQDLTIFGTVTPAKLLPFAMAFDEPGSETRRGYTKIIGLYSDGYPSFYRRATVNLMQDYAKSKFGVTKFEEVTKEQRKQAWRDVQRAIRHLYSASRRQDTKDS